MTGAELKAKRKLVGLSAEELGKRSGLTKQTINNYERGLEVSTPAQRVICWELAKAFVEMDMKDYYNRLYSGLFENEES